MNNDFQILYNYRRQSMEGWCIYYTWFDLIGALGSLIQMFIMAANSGNQGFILFLSSVLLPPASAVEVIESELCVCVSVCKHSHSRTV